MGGRREGPLQKEGKECHTQQAWLQAEAQDPGDSPGTGSADLLLRWNRGGGRGPHLNRHRLPRVLVTVASQVLLRVFFLTRPLVNRMILEGQRPSPVTTHRGTAEPTQVNHNAHEPLECEGLSLHPAAALENFWGVPTASKGQGSFPKLWDPLLTGWLRVSSSTSKLDVSMGPRSSGM